MELIVKLIEAIAWPVASIWLGYLFRTEVRGLLERLSHLKYGEAEASFEAGVEKIGSELPKISTPVNSAQFSPLSAKEDELIVLAETSARAAVLESWLEVEKALAAAAAKRGLPEGDMAKIFESNPQLSNVEPTFRQLRSLRNQAAHAPKFAPNQAKVQTYIRQTLLLAFLVTLAGDWE